MAKTSMIERDKKRTILVAKYAKKRADLKAKILSDATSFEDKMAAVATLQKMPRDSSVTRSRRRCEDTGRSRGVYRKFGLSRTKIREATMRGDVPGMRKASW